MAIVIQKWESLFFSLNQTDGLRGCRGPWLNSKTSLATHSKYSLLVSVEGKKKKVIQFVKEKKIEQTGP